MITLTAKQKPDNGTSSFPKQSVSKALKERLASIKHVLLSPQASPPFIERNLQVPAMSQDLPIESYHEDLSYLNAMGHVYDGSGLSGVSFSDLSRTDFDQSGAAVSSGFLGVSGPSIASGLGVSDLASSAYELQKSNQYHQYQQSNDHLNEQYQHDYSQSLNQSSNQQPLVQNNHQQHQLSKQAFQQQPLQQQYQQSEQALQQQYLLSMPPHQSPALSSSSSSTQISLGITTPDLTTEYGFVNQQPLNTPHYVHRHSASLPVNGVLMLGLESVSSFESPSPKEDLDSYQLDPAGPVTQVFNSINELGIIGDNIDTVDALGNIEELGIHDQSKNGDPRTINPSILLSTSLSSPSLSTLFAIPGRPLESVPKLATQPIQPAATSSSSASSSSFKQKFANEFRPKLDMNDECNNAISSWLNGNAIEENDAVPEIHAPKNRSNSYSYELNRRNSSAYNAQFFTSKQDFLGSLTGIDTAPSSANSTGSNSIENTHTNHSSSAGQKKRRKSVKGFDDLVAAAATTPISLADSSSKITKNTTRARSQSNPAILSAAVSIAPQVSSVTTSAGTSLNTTSPSGVPASAFPCDSCDKQFKRSEHLKRHVRSVHSASKPYVCSQCDKRFSRTDNLSQHKKTHKRVDEVSQRAKRVG